MDWYALNTKPRHEHQAAMNLASLGIETFCPRLKRRKIVRRQWRDVVSPLFPGYLFARFRVEDSFRAVAYAKGVRKIVSCGDRPTPVSEEIVEGIKARLMEGCLAVPPCQFRPGQVVRIESGPLAGLEAVFERDMTDQQRVVLLLRAIAACWRIVVPCEQVVNL